MKRPTVIDQSNEAEASKTAIIPLLLGDFKMYHDAVKVQLLLVHPWLSTASVEFVEPLVRWIKFHRLLLFYLFTILRFTKER